jgi:hypothetical protein
LPASPEYTTKLTSPDPHPHLTMIQRTRAATPADVDNCKRMYIMGHFALPFMWLINYLYYRHTLVIEGTPEAMKSQIKYSLIQFIVVLLAWILWLVFFYTNLTEDWAQSLRVT